MMLGPTRVIALSRSSYHSTIHDLLAVASHLSYFPLFPVPCLEQSFFSSHILTTPSLDRNTSSASAFTTTRFKSANMSTMPAQHGHSAACCNIPPVIAKDYPIKGKYEEFGGLKSYVTGPDDTKKAILLIYDIFGYFPQTLQGADILANSSATKYKVVMPDWFEGNPASIEWYPPTTEEHQKNLGAFFQKNGPQTVKPRLPGVLKDIQARYPSIESWGIVGFCWGGKVVSVNCSQDGNPFKVAAECHPAMVDPADAEGINVPLCMLASMDEPEETVKKFENTLKVSKHVETFKDQIHGWMAARSDLENPRVKEEYVRGYKTVLEFFEKNWL